MKTTPLISNGWLAFVQAVKDLYPVKELVNKDYSKMMDWYVAGKSAENYVKENVK